ncbi:MAG: DUF349 domain-containing protein [Kineosporiaceae bacterium]
MWLNTGDGERAIGQYPGASEEEALAYFTRKYEDLLAQVALLEQRIELGHVSPADARSQAERLTGTVREANALGDLAALITRLDALGPVIEQRKEAAESARQEERARALESRTALVEEAEALAAVDPERLPWKTSGDRLRELFEDWRRQQRESRLDKRTEDELWKRFSHARTTFDRKRRQHFSALDEQRGLARAAKEALVAEAEALATSTDWAETATAFRDLMGRWKSAGRAARKDDDALWSRFRAAQDTFFGARNAASAEADAKLQDNLVAKEALLAEAEALLPVTDARAARTALRDLHERWEAAGRVPRADLGRLEQRLRAVEHAVRDAEQERWTRSNPQARARAEDAVRQLESTLAALHAQLDKARAAGNARKVSEAEQAIEAREQWLEQARRALHDFGG